MWKTVATGESAKNFQPQPGKTYRMVYRKIPDFGLTVQAAVLGAIKRGWIHGPTGGKVVNAFVSLVYLDRKHYDVTVEMRFPPRASGPSLGKGAVLGFTLAGITVALAASGTFLWILNRTLYSVQELTSISIEAPGGGRFKLSLGAIFVGLAAFMLLTRRKKK